MNSPFASLPQTTKVRLSCVLWGLMQTVRGRAPSGAMPDWMVMALQMRVQRIGQVIGALLLALQAGTLKTRRSPAPGGTRKEAAASATRPMRLPGQFGWLVKIFGWHVTGFGSQLRHLLADPEMVALLAASPRAVRTLKPLCRMLMVELPNSPAPVTPKPTSPTGGGGPVRPVRRRPPRPRAWTPSYNPPLARTTPDDEGKRRGRFKNRMAHREFSRLFRYDYLTKHGRPWTG